MVGIKHNKVVALFTNNIDSCEDEIKSLYAPVNKDVEKSFMHQIIDLINSTRCKKKELII